MVSYLARYANRVVIANDRLIKIEHGEVYFSYKDYRDDNRRKVHRLPGVAFLSQFLQHILPRGLHNKRRYGFWGYHVRTENLTRIRDQLGVPPVEVHHEEVEDTDEPSADGPRPRHCAICKGEIEYVGGTHRPSAPGRIQRAPWNVIFRFGSRRRCHGHGKHRGRGQSLRRLLRLTRFPADRHWRLGFRFGRHRSFGPRGRKTRGPSVGRIATSMASSLRPTVRPIWAPTARLSYTYVGLGTVAREDYEEPDVRLDP